MKFKLLSEAEIRRLIEAGDYQQLASQLYKGTQAEMETQTKLFENREVMMMSENHSRAQTGLRGKSGCGMCNYDPNSDRTPSNLRRLIE